MTTISARQIELVQSTFEQVEPIADTAAGLFYNRLFELDPAIRPMFTHDLNDQGKKLMQTLAVVVHGLNHLNDVVPAVESLGKRHVGYGVTADQYQTVGEALLWTLGQGLGDAFTPEVQEAWTAAYMIVAQTAIGAAYSPN